MDEIKNLLLEQGKAFDAHKKAVDEQLTAVKTLGTESAEVKEKQTRIDTRLDQLEDALAEAGRKANQLQKSTGSEENLEYKKAFETFVRKGEKNDVLVKAMSTVVPGDGGVAVPIEQEKGILALLRDATAMRRICRVMQVSTGDVRLLAQTGGNAAAWQGEKDSISETTNPTVAELTPFMGILHAYPAATQSMLEDGLFDIEKFIIDDCVGTFAQSEEAAFVSGNGVNKPKGFLAASTPVSTADSTRAFGVLQFVATGQASAFQAVAGGTTSPADTFIEVSETLRPGYLPNAKWLMSRAVRATVRKFKDTTSNFIYQPSMVAGEAPMLLGYPVEISDQMPSVAANAFPVAFGDFTRGYTIVDRIGMSVLRNPYASPGYVYFYVRRRVGGVLTDSNAIKLIKISA